MGQLSNLLFIAVMIGVFWFLIIRPQQQRAQQQRQMLEALRPGDEVVTAGGIFGKVVQVDERVLLRVFDGSEMEVARQAIAQRVPAEDLTVSDVDEPAEDEDALNPPIADKDSTPDA